MSKVIYLLVVIILIIILNIVSNHEGITYDNHCNTILVNCSDRNLQGKCTKCMFTNPSDLTASNPSMSPFLISNPDEGCAVNFGPQLNETSTRWYGFMGLAHDFVRPRGECGGSIPCLVTADTSLKGTGETRVGWANGATVFNVRRPRTKDEISGKFVARLPSWGASAPFDSIAGRCYPGCNEGFTPVNYISSISYINPGGDTSSCACVSTIGDINNIIRSGGTLGGGKSTVGLTPIVANGVNDNTIIMGW